MKSWITTRRLLAGGVAVLALSLGIAVAQEVRPPEPPAEKAIHATMEMPGKPSTSPQVPTSLVSSRRIRLNYEIRDVGPSGVKRVELWATRDGKTWQRFSNEPPPAGPLVVQVAEEGKYGFTIVVQSGVGTRSPQPKTGDAPQMWVEVDETKPTVKLHEAYVGKGAEAGHLVVQWSSSDANIVSQPVTLFTSTNPDGPWTAIASNLDATGKHLWLLPKDVAYQFYVRAECIDRAGNVGSDHTLKPIAVDLARPKGMILGVDAESVKSGIQ